MKNKSGAVKLIEKEGSQLNSDNDSEIVDEIALIESESENFKISASSNKGFIHDQRAISTEPEKSAMEVEGTNFEKKPKRKRKSYIQEPIILAEDTEAHVKKLVGKFFENHNPDSKDKKTYGSYAIEIEPKDSISIGDIYNFIKTMLNKTPNVKKTINSVTIIGHATVILYEKLFPPNQKPITTQSSELQSDKEVQELAKKKPIKKTKKPILDENEKSEKIKKIVINEVINYFMKGEYLTGSLKNSPKIYNSYILTFQSEQLTPKDLRRGVKKIYGIKIKKSAITNLGIEVKGFNTLILAAKILPINVLPDFLIKRYREDKSVDESTSPPNQKSAKSSGFFGFMPNAQPHVIQLPDQTAQSSEKLPAQRSSFKGSEKLEHLFEVTTELTQNLDMQDKDKKRIIKHISKHKNYNQLLYSGLEDFLKNEKVLQYIENISDIKTLVKNSNQNLKEIKNLEIKDIETLQNIYDKLKNSNSELQKNIDDITTLLKSTNEVVKKQKRYIELSDSENEKENNSAKFKQ